MASMWTATTRAPGAAPATEITSSASIVIVPPCTKRAPPAFTTIKSGEWAAIASSTSGHQTVSPAT